MGFLDAAGVSALWAKCKSAFAAKSHAHAVATKDADGFMSAEDKAVIESLSGGAVTGVKGERESAYRTGNVNITPANVGAPGADTSNGWCKITFPNGSQSGWLQTTQNGILPYSANGSNVGSWDYQFGDVWANHMHTWGGDVYGATVAYSNDYGTNGTVTLSQSVEGIKRMEIYTRDNDWVRDCTSLFYPQGCVAALCISSKTPTGSFWEKKSVILVSGNAITVQRAGCVDGSGNSQGDANTNNVFVTRVVLYNN